MTTQSAPLSQSGTFNGGKYIKRSASLHITLAEYRAAIEGTFSRFREVKLELIDLLCPRQPQEKKRLEGIIPTISKNESAADVPQ
jgi:hypothetical protein